MRRYIVLLVILIISFASCECPYAEWDDYGYREYRGTTARITYNQDYFCAEKLLGTWQMDYGCIVGNVELKEIKFLDGKRCDIVMAIVRNPDWFTETWTYTYYGNTIKFARNDGWTNITFFINGYVFPELYLQDSFGRYTWRKVRAYGC